MSIIESSGQTYMAGALHGHDTRLRSILQPQRVAPSFIEYGQHRSQCRIHSLRCRQRPLRSHHHALISPVDAAGVVRRRRRGGARTAPSLARCDVACARSWLLLPRAVINRAWTIDNHLPQVTNLANAAECVAGFSIALTSYQMSNHEWFVELNESDGESMMMKPSLGILFALAALGVLPAVASAEGSVKVECFGRCDLVSLGQACDTFSLNSLPVAIACDDTGVGAGINVTCGSATCRPFGSIVRSDRVSHYCDDGAGFDAVVTCRIPGTLAAAADQEASAADQEASIEKRDDAAK